MRKQKQIVVANPLTVDFKTLQGTLGVGETTARRIGKESGALIKIGRRSVYRIDKIKEYLESIGG